MAILPDPMQKPAAGLPGMLQNMEEWNAFSAFASDTATAAIGFGQPVSLNGAADDGTAKVKALATTEVLAGIARDNLTTGNATDQTLYADNDLLGVLTMGVIYGMAGGAVTIGGAVFYNPSDGSYYGATATGYLELPGCSFDQSAVAGEVVPIRVNVVPGGDAITAGI